MYNGLHPSGRFLDNAECLASDQSQLLLLSCQTYLISKNQPSLTDGFFQTFEV